MTAAETKSVKKAVMGVANDSGKVKNAVPEPELPDVFAGSNAMIASL